MFDQLILAVLLLGATGSGEHTELAPSPTVIHFCHFEVSEKVTQMNASFSVIYSAEIGSEGGLENIKMIKDGYLEFETVTTCLQQWRLPRLRQGSELIIAANWKHGVGWLNQSLVGEDFHQHIVRTGEFHPYPCRPAQ